MASPAEYVQNANRINEALSRHAAAGVPLSRHLVDAGDAAADVLKRLLEDQAFWTHLASPRDEGDASPDPYAAVVTQYHAAVLTALGYRPPPPAQAVAQGVADAIVAKRGAPAQSLAEVKASIAGLKDQLVQLTGAARARLAKPDAAANHPDAGSAAPSAWDKLKAKIALANSITLTAAALVGMFYGPLFPPSPAPSQPPPTPPPVVIVVPRDALPPGLHTPPPGTEARGRLYFYRALPRPDDNGDNPPGTAT